MDGKTLDLGALFDAHRWDGRLRITIQGAVRAPIVNGEVTLDAGSWRADIHVGRKQAVLPIIGDSPADVLRQLADLAEAGEVSFTD